MFFRILISVILAVIWMIINSTFSLPMFVVGLIIGWCLSFFYDIVTESKPDSKSPTKADVKRVLKNIPNATALVFVFIGELLKANVAVLAAVFGSKSRVKPGIIAMPIELEKDFDIVALSNMITLTPGTITVEVSRDRKTLYIHALDASDPQGVIDGINKTFADKLRKGEL